MKKILAALSISFAAIAPAAVAQTPAPAAVVMPAADPAALAAANELLQSMNYRDVVGKMFDQMRRTMPSIMQQGAANAINNDSSLDAAQKADAIQKMTKDLGAVTEEMSGIFSDPAVFEEMMRATAGVYARHFTVTELRQIAAFYKTPVGVKTLTIMPQLMNESMLIGQQIVMPRIGKVMEKLKAK